MSAARPEGASIHARSIGEAWLAVARSIVADGEASAYDGKPILELAHQTLVVDAPDPDDALIARHGDAERLRWMRANFAELSLVEELGGARSYASRLLDYAGSGRDQVEWVIERLRSDAASRSATITTFEPLSDVSYIPCVSLLDFWLRNDSLELVVYAHSIDFGAKGYGNLVELALLSHRVATALAVPSGELRFIVKSAHIYDTELATMRAILAAEERPAAV
jgi:thymidylate synthase